MLRRLFDQAYSSVERRVIRFETLRRGQAYVKDVKLGGAPISSLKDIPLLVGDAEVISFDLFDTLIHRARAPLNEVMQKTAQFGAMTLGDEYGPELYGVRGFWAEEIKARMIREDEGNEPPLRVVFADMLQARGFNAARAASYARRLERFETEVEKRNVAPGADAADVLSALKARGLKVIAVSDMYLFEEEIGELLGACGLSERFDAVFVSANAKATKASGDLMAHVAKSLGVAPHKIIHVGDRRKGDYDMPRRLGVRAYHYVNERELKEARAAHLAWTHPPSPALRRSDLSKAYGIGVEAGAIRTPEDVVERLIGPACGLTTLAAFARADRIGARRIAHLTRDATILGDIAVEARESFPHLAEEGLEIGHLAVSRAVATLLEYRSPSDLKLLRFNTTYLTGGAFSVAAMVRGVGLSEADVPERLRDAPNWMEFQRGLDGNAGDAEALFAAIDARRKALVVYLRGAGLEDSATTLAVDIGYSGTFARLASQFFAERDVPDRRLDFMFFASSRFYYANAQTLHPQVTVRPGVVLDHRLRSCKAATVNFAWLEPFLVDPSRGRLNGYDDETPVFAPSPYSEERREYLCALRARLKDRALGFIDDFHGRPGDFQEVQALVRTAVARFAGDPSYREAQSLDAMGHQMGQADLRVRRPTRWVNPLKLPVEINRLRMGDYWLQGSLKRSGLGLLNKFGGAGREPETRRRTQGEWR